MSPGIFLVIKEILACIPLSDNATFEILSIQYLNSGHHG